jgi:serine/threonine protein kinase
MRAIELDQADDLVGPNAEPSTFPGDGSSETSARCLAGKLIPAHVPPERVPDLVEMVKLDIGQQWLRGRPVDVESYLSAFPELGTVETAPVELILAEAEARCRTGAPMDLAHYERRFPHQAASLRRHLDARALDTNPGSLLAPIMRPGAWAENLRLTLGRNGKAATVLPRRFGRYRILEEIGRGAMGTVYLARDTQLRRQVALKVPHARADDGAQSPGPRALDRFYREAHAAAVVRHPNICPVHDVGRIGGIPFLTMGYIRGTPLSRVLRRDAFFPARRAAILVRKVALAMQAAHDKGVVHRDLKPSNVMICEDGEPMVMDFGLAWRLDHRDGDERLTRLGLVLGTPAYMSPEQLSGRVEALGPRCDVYSLGVILYELLTGRCPFEGPEAVVLGQILYQEPEPPSARRPALNPRLEGICLRAMAKREQARYVTMADLASDLTEFLRETRPSPRPTISPIVPPDPGDGAASGINRPVESAPRAVAVHPAECGDPIPRHEDMPARPGRVPSTPIAPSGLPKAWRRWTAIVASFASGRPTRRTADQRAFEVLRGQLLEALRARAAEADGPERDLLLQLEAMVSPWVSVRSLAREDREILRDLLARCRAAEEFLGGRGSQAGRAVLTAVWLILLAALSLIVWSKLAS